MKHMFPGFIMIPMLLGKENFHIADDMAGHAGMASYIRQGYEIITL